MIEKANTIPNKFMRLRAKAMVALSKTGKREGEIIGVSQDDLKVEGNYLVVTFVLEKKRQKEPVEVSRRFELNGKWAPMILEYSNFLKEKIPECMWLFPHGHLGLDGKYIIHAIQNKNRVMQVFTHKRKSDGKVLSVERRPIGTMSGRAFRRTIKFLNPKAWHHLFRETRGAEIVKADEKEHGQANLETIFKVREDLNLEKEDTAWHYVRRHGTPKVEIEPIH